MRFPLKNTALTPKVKRAPRVRGSFLAVRSTCVATATVRLDSSEGVYDVAEDRANLRPQQCQNHDHYNGYENKNQRILNQALPLFTWNEKHPTHLPSVMKF
jgi:hypothetical protein